MTGLKDFETGLSYVTVLVLMVIAGCFCQEWDGAHRSRGGALLCPLVEDFYSYKISTSYGPARWAEISECCGGQRQSPINLQSNSKLFCGQGSPLSYNSTRGISGKLYNNGHDPTIAFRGWDTAYLFNAPYTSGAYILHNLHVHFCSEPSKGSEHAIDGRFYQGEVHLVHFKASYGSLERAVLYEDGLVVIGIMLQAVPVHDSNVNGEMFRIIQRMNDLQGVGKENQISIQVNVAGIFPRSTTFFTYAGSMTSPPCSESVRWIVFHEPINISTREMDILKRLPNEERRYIALGCNDRPLQNGNTTVETNYACTSNGVGEDPDTMSMYF